SGWAAASGRRSSGTQVHQNGQRTREVNARALHVPEQFSLSGFDVAPKKTDVLFFAIFPDAAAAARIARLAQRLRSEHGLKANPLRTERFHITLHHIGDYAGLPQGVVAKAISAAATIAMPPFEVTFD